MIVPLSLAALLSAPVHGPAPVVLEGARFRVHVHFEAPDIGAQALEVVEATWDVAAPLHGLDGGPDRLLDVHLYPDAAGYEAVEQELTGGVFRRNLAFAHWNSKSAHVALQPPLADEALEVVGLPYLTARFLAHEAAHLVRFAAMPNYRFHPGWFADGSATWVEVRVLEALGLLESRVNDPLSGTDVRLVRRLIGAGRLPEVRDILMGATPELGFYERYSVHWLLFEMLAAKHPERLARLRAEVRRLKGGDGYARRAREAYERALGATLGVLDDDLRQYVGSLRTEWREIYRSLETAGDEWVHAAFGDTAATALRTEPIDGEGFRLSGSLTLLPGGAGRAHLFLGHTDDAWLQLTFHADTGLELHEVRGASRLLAKRELQQVTRNHPFTFDLHYAKDTGVLSVHVDGHPAYVGDAPLDVTGTWGLGVDAASAAVWRGVELTK